MSENIDGDVHLLVKLSTKVLQFIHKYQLVVDSWPNSETDEGVSQTWLKSISFYGVVKSKR